MTAIWVDVILLGCLLFHEDVIYSIYDGTYDVCVYDLMGNVTEIMYVFAI